MAAARSNTSLKMRIIHRYLGFFLSGIMAVYALSGIVLIYRDTDTFKKTINKEFKAAAGISQDDLGKALDVRKLKVTRVTGDTYYFKEGTYNVATGDAKFTVKEMPYVLDKMTHLHKADTDHPLYYLNIFFGTGLLFFVISSFWMFIPSSSIFKKGLWFAAGGLVLTLVLLFI